MSTTNQSAWLRRELDNLGLPKCNVPRWTPDSKLGTKAVVMVEYFNGRGQQVHKLIRFGNWEHPHNYHADAVKNWWQRNSGKATKKQNPEYWEGYYLWALGSDIRAIGDKTKRSGLMIKGKRPGGK